MIQYINGNILDAEENIIVQSVNHQGKMGSGLARQIVSKWPEINTPDSMYQTMCKNMTFEDIRSNGSIVWYAIDENKKVACIFGQDKYGRDKQYTDYLALGNGFETVRNLAKHYSMSVAIPSAIGCGLGGGLWDIVKEMIENCFSYAPEVNVSIYEYENMKSGMPY